MKTQYEKNGKNNESLMELVLLVVYRLKEKPNNRKRVLIISLI